MTKLRLWAAFLILVGAGAVQAAETGAVGPATPSSPVQAAAFRVAASIPTPFFAAKTSCEAELNCCDGSTVVCTGSICRVGPNKVVCDNIPHFCPICP